MSFTTGTQFETISSANAAGTSLANSASGGVLNHLTGAGFLPANFFMPSYGVSKALKIYGRGIISTAASANPTLTIGCYFNATQGTYSTSNSPCPSAAIAVGNSWANQFWEFEADIVCQVTGSSGKFVGMGEFTVITATTGTSSMWALGSTSQVTISTETNYYAELGAIWGSAVSGTTITCEQFFVYGVN